MDTAHSIGIGVVGCGGMGLGVVRDVLRADPRLRVAALFDPDPRSIARALNEIPGPPRVCPDLDALLAEPGIDWVMIASWNAWHCEQTLAAFAAGRHVFCQKPLALTLDECRRMRRAWEASGRMFALGFTLRYSPHYRKIRQLVAGGCIGRLVSMEFNETLDFNHGGYIMGDWRRLRRHAGTHLLEKCSHDIDLANWIAGSRARRVASFGGLDFFRPENAGRAEAIAPGPNGERAYSAWDGLVKMDPFHSDKDIVDNQVAVIEFENGVRATFHTNANSGLPERRMYLVGTEGAIRSDVLSGRIEMRRIGFGTPVEDVSAGISGMHGGGDPVLGRELAAAMLEGAPPAAGFMEGLEAAVTCFAIDDAMDAGTVVDLGAYWRAVE